MEFFNQESRNYFKNIKNRIEDEISSMSDIEINSCDFEEWKKYMYSRYSVDAIVLFEENVERDLAEQKVKRHNTFYHMDSHEQEYYTVDGYCITFKIYYGGSPDLFRLQPSTYIMKTFRPASFSEPKGDKCGYFSIELTYSKNELENKDDVQAYIKSAFDSNLKDYRRMIEYVNNDATFFNSSILTFVESLLIARKEKASVFASLSKKLEIPLKLSVDAPNIQPIPLKRVSHKPPKKPTTKPQPADYSISDDDYRNINNIIYMNGTSMEHTARTYFRNNEEELRDHLIATLNTHYENVTGETFRKIGKTDILIEFENRAAFVGECKIWHGVKKFEEAVQQLLNYSTWKDTKCSIVIFNKNIKNFQKIINTTEQWLNDNTKSYQKVKNNIWDCTLYREDMEVDIKINISIFDLYVDKSQFKDSRNI